MIITLLTDFGTSGYFVAALKGVILSIDPRITIVDIAHDVPRHDVAAAAFILAAVYHDFPAGTVHLAVVDPGVGSSRLPVAMTSEGHYFVGPNNGLFDQVDQDGTAEVRQLESSLIRRKDASATFHGRDIFAPAAAALATGFPFAGVGSRLDRPGATPLPPRKLTPSSPLIGSILHVDHFGNCVTSFREVEVGHPDSDLCVRGDGWELSTVRRFYEEGGDSDAPFIILGSAGFLEIAVYRGSAAATLGIEVGDSVSVRRLT